ncbi:hypothetical protein JEZ13_11215 [bacterium]|nr:hypothetical protein [bacterium]
MKVKFRFGIKSYSGTLDELVYANYADRSIVIGRMLPKFEELTPQNISIQSKASLIANLYEAISDDFKADLTSYTKKMYKLKAFKDKLRGNAYSTYVKMIYSAANDTENQLDIDSLSADDLALGVYSQINSVQVAVENGYLPKVKGYEDYTNTLSA